MIPETCLTKNQQNIIQNYQRSIKNRTNQQIASAGVAIFGKSNRATHISIRTNLRSIIHHTRINTCNVYMPHPDQENLADPTSL